MENRKSLIVVTVAVLLAIGVAGAVVFFMLSGSGVVQFKLSDVLPSFGGGAVPQPSAVPSSDREVSVGFETSVLGRSDYTGLDTSLLQQGLLPVRPVEPRGKANPFL